MLDFRWQLELTRPMWLAGLVVLLWLAIYYRRSLVDFARWQRIGSLIVRALVVLLLVLALCGLTLLQPTRQQFVVFAVDQSDSVGDQSRRTVNRFMEQALRAAGSHGVSFVRFAAKPGMVETEWSQDAAELDGRGTDLQAAVEVAAAAMPPFYVPRIVLLTDGNQTKGDVHSAAVAAEVPILTVPLATRDDPEVQVSAIRVPAQVAEGEPFYVEVVIDSNHEDEGTVEVFRGPHKIVEQQHKVTKGESRFRFRQAVTGQRLSSFVVRIRGFRDTLLDNNHDTGLVYTAGKPRVLLIESEPKRGQHLAWALEEEDVHVDIRPPEGMPEALADLQNYELLILSNVPATSLTLRQMALARTYVEDLGGGLIMVGGDQSFGLGGYYKTTLEEILPVRSDFEKEKEKPSLAMALVIDKSGSMGGEKIELAKDAAKNAVELLGGRDQIGVIAFDGETYWVSDLHLCTDKGYMLDHISTIEAGGGTSMYPAMEEAYLALSSTTAKLKHVIILTDGISAPGDFEGIARSMTSARITVSTVAVGQGADAQLLEDIARIGQGRFYACDDPSAVPQIFAKETVTVSKSAINELPFVPQVVRPSGVLDELGIESAPLLLGYVITRAKPTSEFILASEAGDPLLVWWRYGLGMTVAFTSDAKNRWAAEWLAWPGYSKFWAQLVRHSMRKSEAKGVVVQVDQRGGRATVKLDAVDPTGKYLNNVDTSLTLIDPRLEKRELSMTQVAPGRYETDFPADRSGTYHLELAQQNAGQVLHRQTRGMVVGYPEELRLRPANEQLLRTIAGTTGGMYDPSPEEVFAPTGRTASRAIPLWPYLVMAAAMLLLADVALRRIDFAAVFGRPRHAV